MDTNTINPTNGKKTDKKGKIATKTATMAAAAGLGVAGAMAMNTEQEVSPISDNEHKGVADTTSQTQATNSHPNASTQSSTSTTNSPSENTINTIVSDEPQPITGLEDTEEGISEDSNELDAGNNIESDEEAEVNESELSGNEIENDESFSPEITSLEEIIDSEEIVEGIISEEQVDPNDIDLTDVISFDEIGMVYNVDGESYTAATFHDESGNQMMMVDVDGDDVFDVVTDTSGNTLIDADGNLVATGDLTVDDAEIAVSTDPTYLASSDIESIEDFGVDSIINDMIS